MSASAALSLPSLSKTEKWEIGERIFQNETGGDKTKLVYWNPKEAFASMGIGHFVWPHPKIRYLQNTFALFLEFCTENGVVIPAWLQEDRECPWSSYDDFEEAKHLSQFSKIVDLIGFLDVHRQIQIDFIILNFSKCFEKIIEQVPQSKQEDAIAYCNLLLQTPSGCFALIDYWHCKGDGLSEALQYQKEGWGLKQVIERAVEKEWHTNPLEVFVESAKETLANRVKNAPEECQEKECSFLLGWHKRLDRYQESPGL